MSERPQNGSQARINPLKRVSKELFQHGREHVSHESYSSFDRLVAGVHVDNALELFLKFYGAKHNILGYKQKLVPELITLLQPHIPELVQCGEDLRIFHDFRDLAYHMGLPLDDVNLSWGMDAVKSFVDQVEQREKKGVTITGSALYSTGAYSIDDEYDLAQKELEKALNLLRQLPFSATKEQITEVLSHMFNAVEHWLNHRLKQHPRLVPQKQIGELTLGRKIEILRREIKDTVLLNELRRINDLRAAVIHSREVRIDPSEVYRYLQIVMHFIKVESPSRYGVIDAAREVEERIERILQKHRFVYRKDCLLEGYSRNSRFDFVLEKDKAVIELRVGRARAPNAVPDIFLESLAFRIVDLKRMDKHWKFIIVLSGRWSKRSEEMLKKYSDHVLRIEDFEAFARKMPWSRRNL